ncbi:MAG: NAD(P)/FAD-dependent oxidoreductase [Clostridia bacterium]|jgi:thioredoxin reductase (NADPH)|nr:NAD(P)/FAD-dependent oxidoreductase [Clostridia bacterium]
MYDIIIIGSGPAGVSAAVYAKRGGANVLVISKDTGTLGKAKKIENYYGFKNISGKDLYENGLKQLENLNIEFVKDEVVQLNYTSQFEVTTVNNIFQAKYVVLATGVSRNVPNIKGIKEFEGKGVSYCAICDAFFYRNKDVAVLGSGNYAIHEAEILKPVVKSVTLLTNSEKLVENRDIDLNVNEKKVREVRGFEKVDEIVFEDDTAQNINGIFVAIGTASTNDLARKIGARVENNKIIVNDNLETTVPNLYACGDCTGGILQISKATYEGTKVGLEIVNKLKNKNN